MLKSALGLQEDWTGGPGGFDTFYVPGLEPGFGDPFYGLGSHMGDLGPRRLACLSPACLLISWDTWGNSSVVDVFIGGRSLSSGIGYFQANTNQIGNSSLWTGFVSMVERIFGIPEDAALSTKTCDDLRKYGAELKVGGGAVAGVGAMLSRIGTMSATPILSSAGAAVFVAGASSGLSGAVVEEIANRPCPPR